MIKRGVKCKRKEENTKAWREFTTFKANHSLKLRIKLRKSNDMEVIMKTVL